MELRRLRYFVVVAEELSFNLAAKALHIAQPLSPTVELGMVWRRDGRNADLESFLRVTREIPHDGSLAEETLEQQNKRKG